ncbi:PEP-CTERM sorting domain-containing protein [Nitrogeniibacter mangrovi]|uniref:PEP-CTERM sorting domain-containing protein n=1 Tax=Nitrogeniibacter mangrovi TaxID=2016596 RepID=A0A6C1B123_9RHOO|nr:PEP-CTERM sorting domain-containing protein [Nitrogeniibacter mangrovi]QID16689.1 PEP-CTERM sorting domain-containing protein [Nitrogeniibacter mangrovi]
MNTGHLLALATGLALTMAPAHADPLSCDGDLSFIDGANTRIACSGDLVLDGNALSADESIWVHSDTRIEVIDATLRAPAIMLDALQINVAGRLSADGAISLGVPPTHSGDTIRWTDSGPVALAGDGIALSPGSRLTLWSDATRSGDGGPAAQAGGSIALSPHGQLTLSDGSMSPGSTISVVPEPTVWAMLLAGLTLLSWAPKRRR